MRQIEATGLKQYVDTVIGAELSHNFWEDLLPQVMDTSSSISPYFTAFKAAQAKMGDTGFLSRDIKALDLLLNRTDVHHLYPKNHLKQQQLARGQYNQIANFALTQSEINIAIGDKAPEVYFKQLADQCNGGPKLYGSITDIGDMRANLRVNCIPVSMLDGNIPLYADFLKERRRLMAARLRTWFATL
jgi:hypothetical protein